LTQRDFTIAQPLFLPANEARDFAGVVTADRIRELNTQAREQFTNLVQKLNRLTADSQWLRFEGGVPSLIPGDAADGSRDIMVYRGAIVVIQTGDEIDVLRFGELIESGRTWKLTEMPVVVAPNSTIALRQNASFANVSSGASAESDAAADALQPLISQLTKLDEEAARAGGPAAATARYHLSRADTIEKIIAETNSASERAEWQRQFADSLVAALQLEASDAVTQRLTRLATTLRQDQEQTNLAAYIAFRRISADYTRKMHAPGVDFETVQKDWLEQLDQFVTEFPGADESAEALSQLGVGMEFTGKDDQAKQYYQKLVETFPKNVAARRAAGAIRRLNMVGKPFRLEASDLRRGTVDTRRLDGKVVLVDFWATNCDPWKNDLPRLKELYAKYHSKGFEIVGVSLDGDKADTVRFVQSSGITWPIAFEQGGLESAPALSYGIIALPTQFLIGADGKVVNRSLHISQLEEELRRLLK